jgi:excisionase family DNA binding protein
MDKPFEKRMLTTSDVAEFVGFNTSTIALWARIGNINGTKIGGRWRFEEREVFDFLADRGAATDQRVNACFAHHSAKAKRS